MITPDNLDPVAAYSDPIIAGIEYARQHHLTGGPLPAAIIKDRADLARTLPAPALPSPMPLSLDLATEPATGHAHPLHSAGEVITAHVLAMVDAATAEREARENHRANRRNINRVLVLAFAAVAGFLTVFMSTHGVLPGMLPYSFCVAVGLDTLVTLYAYLRRY
jgi:hypothetical protein